MNLVFVDLETYYSKEYSLRRMTPAQYVLDPRFEAIGCAVKEGVNGKSYWVDGDAMPAFFAGLDPKVTCMGSHNWLFDGCVVAWRYGFVPKLMFDTLSISRATLRPWLRSCALKSVMHHLKIGEKGETVHKVEGMNLAAIKFAGLYDEYIRYSLNDVDGCAGIFAKVVVAGVMPMAQLRTMDMVLRTTIEPRFVLDPELLALHLAEVKAKKETLLAQAVMLGADSKSSLMSNPQFAKLLAENGVEPPMKRSPTTGEPVYAFAKTDVDFLALADHENQAVQALVAARLGHKSTLEESRAQRFIDLSRLDWGVCPVTPLGNMPMPLAPSAAHTHRLGGDWSLNVQNLPRGGNLRRALKAPAGYKVLTADAAQIEAREVVYFSGQEDVVEQFRRGEDTYASLASDVFGFAVNKKDHPKERFVGKQARLGLGYQLWWPKFQTRLKTDSKNQLGEMISLSDAEAMKVVLTFRRLNYKVEQAWKLLDSEGVGTLVRGGKFEFAACVFSLGEVLLPNGMKLHYRNMEYAFSRKKNRQQWTYEYAGTRHDIYGGKIMENLMQALAGVHTLDAALRVQDRSLNELGTCYRLAQQAHDENVFVVRDEHVDAMKAILYEEMCRKDVWAPALPLDAEVGVGQTYGDAK